MRRATLLVAVSVAWSSLVGAAGFPEVKGWQPVGEVASYGADSLWELVDGAADQFLAYGFQQLQARELESGGVRVTVNVYEMGSALDAFGVFHAEAAGSSELPIAAGAVVSPPYQCLLVKDRYYVKVEASQGEISAGMGEALVGAIVAALPGADGPPEAVRLLPKGAVEGGSLGYTRERFLGLAELPPCVHGALTGAGKGAQVFVAVPRQGQSADGVWRALAARWKQVEHPGRPIMVRTLPSGGVAGVIRTEAGILGVAGVEEQDELLQRLEALVR